MTDYLTNGLSRMDYRLLGLPIATCLHFIAGRGLRSVVRRTRKDEKPRKNETEYLIDWELALVSTLHSVACIAFAIVSLLELEDDKIKGFSKWIEVSCMHSIGFFIYDA